MFTDRRRTALVIAHPGHELPIHGYIERDCPVTYVLTDGSGRAGQARIRSTARILEQLGATPGDLFGTYPDQTLYNKVLSVDSSFFLDLSDKLSQYFIRQRVERVIGDAEEHQIMIHDLFRMVRLRAVKLAEEALGWPIQHYDYLLDLPMDSWRDRFQDQTVCLELEPEAFAKKMTSARCYEEVRIFVDEALERQAEDSFQREFFYPVVSDGVPEPATFMPAYERHGEAVVKKGLYPEVVRYADHIWPLYQALKPPRLRASA